MHQIAIKLRHGSQAEVVALSGELDLSTAHSVQREFERIEDRDPAVLVLDLRQVSFMDSTGLRMLLGAHVRARRGRRRVVFVRGPEAVHRVFRITRVDGQLEFVDDPSDLQG